jgi:hypothetical protein
VTLIEVGYTVIGIVEALDEAGYGLIGSVETLSEVGYGLIGTLTEAGYGLIDSIKALLESAEIQSDLKSLLLLTMYFEFVQVFLPFWHNINYLSN